MILPGKKSHLHLKNGTRWDSFLKSITRATENTCVYKIVAKNIPLGCTRRRQAPDKTGYRIVIKLGLFLSCFIRGWTLLILSFSVFYGKTIFSFLVNYSLCSPFPLCALFSSEDLCFPALLAWFPLQV